MAILRGSCIAEVPGIQRRYFSDVDGDRVRDRHTLEVAVVQTALRMRFTLAAAPGPHTAVVIRRPEPRLELGQPWIRVGLQDDRRKAQLVLHIEGERPRVELDYLS